MSGSVPIVGFSRAARYTGISNLAAGSLRPSDRGQTWLQSIEIVFKRRQTTESARGQSGRESGARQIDLMSFTNGILIKRTDLAVNPTGPQWCSAYCY